MQGIIIEEILSLPGVGIFNNWYQIKIMLNVTINFICTILLYFCSL